MNPEDLLAYVDAIFGYCLKRLHHIEDARDLTQEILCELLASMKRQAIDHPHAWVWTVAHHQYCRYLRRKARPVCTLEDSDAVLPEPEEDDGLDERRAVFRALHSLAQSHREVMVDFYVSGLSCAQIAQKYGLTPEAVRSRLFYGREKLRQRWQIHMEENRIYERNEWFITGNGDVNTGLIKRQIVRSIITACYEQFQTVEQLSLSTGIPALYIEDELEPLAEAGALEEKNGKYRAGMILRPQHLSDGVDRELFRFARELSEPLEEALNVLLPRIRAIGFHGCDLPRERLCFSLIPMLLRKAITQARSRHPALIRGNFPLHADGSRGWLCAYLRPEDSLRHASGCNTYFRDHSRFRYFWSHTTFSDELGRLLYRLENETLTGAEISITDEPLLAECIRCDLLVRKAGVLEWNIPVLNSGELHRLIAEMQQPAAALADLLQPAVDAIYQRLLCETPDHLHDQIRGMFGLEFNAIISMLCELLLPKPEAFPFAGQVVLLTGDASALSL